MEFVVAEKLDRTVGELRRTMSAREFVGWQAKLNLDAKIQDVRSRHPKWGAERVLGWVRNMAELSRRGKKEKER